MTSFEELEDEQSCAARLESWHTLCNMIFPQPTPINLSMVPPFSTMAVASLLRKECEAYSDLILHIFE